MLTNRSRRDKGIAWGLAILPLPVAFIIIFLSERFTSASWRFVFIWNGLGYSVWGGALLASGIPMILALLGRCTYRKVVAYSVGCYVTGLWWMFLAALFLAKAITDPLANPIGVPVWAAVGALYWWWGWYERQRVC